MSTRTVTNPEIGPDAMRAYRAAKALHRDGGTPASVFELLASIVEDRTWERLRDAEGKPFPSFTAFVEGIEPYGLGTTGAELQKVLSLKHPHESTGGPWKAQAGELRREVARLLGEDQEEARSPGRPPEIERGTFNPVGRPDTAEKTLARLKRDDPHLAARVVSGEVSANAAARQMGWRKPRVVLTNPEAVARKIRENFTADQIAQLIKLLLED